MRQEYKKLSVGIVGLTGCAGCQLEVLFDPEFLELVELVEFSSFPFIKERRKNEHERMDVMFIEEMVATEEDVQVLEKLRGRAAMFIALGSCAVLGKVPSCPRIGGMRHDLQNHKSSVARPHMRPVGPHPVSKYVDVAVEIRGCPIVSDEVKSILKDIARDETPRVFDKPVCFECTMNENPCFLENGELCMGPLTTGGCNAICINNNHPCTGCRGCHDDTNLQGFLETLSFRGIGKERTADFLNELACRPNKQAGE